MILITDAFKILCIVFGMQPLVQFAYLRNWVLLKLGGYMFLKIKSNRDLFLPRNFTHSSFYALSALL